VLLQDINVNSIWIGINTVSASSDFQTNTLHTKLCRWIIPCGTNGQVNAQLFDLQGAYKAMTKGIILYWLINAGTCLHQGHNDENVRPTVLSWVSAPVLSVDAKQQPRFPYALRLAVWDAHAHFHTQTLTKPLMLSLCTLANENEGGMVQQKSSHRVPKRLRHAGKCLFRVRSDSLIGWKIKLR